MHPLIVELGMLAHRSHFWVDEDNWYSCPKAPDGCTNDTWPAGVCNCGADEHNARADKILALLEQHSSKGPIERITMELRWMRAPNGIPLYINGELDGYFVLQYREGVTHDATWEDVPACEPHTEGGGNG